MTTAQISILIVVLAIAAIAIARFEVMCLRDLAGTADVDLRYLNRSGWTAAILLAIPLGGIAFLYARRNS